MFTGVKESKSYLSQRPVVIYVDYLQGIISRYVLQMCLPALVSVKYLLKMFLPALVSVKYFLPRSMF